MTDTKRPIRRALVSVYDKTGLTDLAIALHAAGVELVSTGSTAKTIAAAGIPVTEVSQLTGFPECLEGRVKSLHQRPIDVTVIDQQPVSLNQEVKVEFSSKVQPTRKDVEDQRGILAWDFTMQPDEERVLEFGHRITWPSAKQIDVTN